MTSWPLDLGCQKVLVTGAGISLATLRFLPAKTGH